MLDTPVKCKDGDKTVSIDVALLNSKGGNRNEGARKNVALVLENYDEKVSRLSDVALNGGLTKR